MIWLKIPKVYWQNYYRKLFFRVFHSSTRGQWGKVIFFSNVKLIGLQSLETGDHLNVRMLSCEYRNYHYMYKDNTVSKPSYHYDGNLHTWKDRLYIETGQVCDKILNTMKAWTHMSAHSRQDLNAFSWRPNAKIITISKINFFTCNYQ